MEANFALVPLLRCGTDAVDLVFGTVAVLVGGGHDEDCRDGGADRSTEAEWQGPEGPREIQFRAIRNFGPGQEFELSSSKTH